MLSYLKFILQEAQEERTLPPLVLLDTLHRFVLQLRYLEVGTRPWLVCSKSYTAHPSTCTQDENKIRHSRFRLRLRRLSPLWRLFVKATTKNTSKQNCRYYHGFPMRYLLRGPMYKMKPCCSARKIKLPIAKIWNYVGMCR